MIGTPIIAAQPIASSNASSSDDCLLVGRRRSANPSPCYTKRIEGYVEKPTVSAFIQTFKDLHTQQAVTEQVTHNKSHTTGPGPSPVTRPGPWASLKPT